MNVINTASLLDQLNRFRERTNMKPLKSWKESRAKLIEALNKLTPANETFEATPDELAKQQTREEIERERIAQLSPDADDTSTVGTAQPEKTQRLREARKQNEAKDASLQKLEAEQPSPSAAPTKSTKKAKKISKAAKQRAGFSAAKVIAEFGIDPKQGRALLRKHNVAKTPEAVRAFFKARAK